MSSAAIRAATLHMLPAFLAARDLDAEPIFRQCGMAAEDVGTPRIVARSQIHHVLKLAADAVGTAEIGLLLGAAADPDRLGPTGSAMKAGATLASCLRAHMQSMPAMQSHVTLGLRREGTAVALTHRLVGDDETAWLLYEGAAAFHIRMLRNLLGPDWAPECVSFPHARKGRRLAYEEFFRAPVAFGQHDETRILFAQDLLSRPLGGRMGHPFEGDREGPALAPLDGFRLGSRDIEIAVARMIETTLPIRPIGLPEAAAVLGLSPRSLQRRLGERGAVFEQIIDARRHAIAIEQLSRTGLDVTSVAMVLGYSDVAHFNRAFRRWEGLPPTEYRRRQQGEPG